MKIFLLKPVDEGKWPFDKWDIHIGFVVRAADESEARAIADKSAYKVDPVVNVWNDDRVTSCVEISTSGRSEVILDSFKAG